MYKNHALLACVHARQALLVFVKLNNCISLRDLVVPILNIIHDTPAKNLEFRHAEDVSNDIYVQP